MMLARDPRARPRLLAALATRLRPGDVDRRIHRRADAKLLAREALHRDRLAARPGPAPPPANLAADLRNVAVTGHDIGVCGLGRQLGLPFGPVLFIITIIGTHVGFLL